MRILNAIAPETAALIRAHIAGKPVPKAIAKAPKKPPGPKAMVTQLHRYLPNRNAEYVLDGFGCHVIQLPIYLTQPKRFVPPNGMTSRQIKWRLMREAEEYAELRQSIVRNIQRYLPNGIVGLNAIEYVRLSIYGGGPKEMDDDNLVACFKIVRDAVCAYARWGADWELHLDALGHADGFLKQQGVKWVYRQTKCEANPRAHGIQIWLHCAPRTTE